MPSNLLTFVSFIRLFTAFNNLYEIGSINCGILFSPKDLSISNLVLPFFIYTSVSMLVYLLIYVDDILVTGIDMSFIHKLIENLNSAFALKDLGPSIVFLALRPLELPLISLCHRQNTLMIYCIGLT